MMTENSMATPEVQTPVETRDIGDAIDILVQAMSINRVIWLAVPHTDVNPAERDGMMYIVDYIDDLLKDVKTILHANIPCGDVQ